MPKYIAFVAFTLIVALGAVAQSDPIATLQSAASLEEKAEACRLISISGDVNALPILEPLLADAEISHMARYAIEPMPGTEADAVLRRALNTTSGELKAGVVSSLGVRRDAAAVAEIIPLLADENTFVAEAAARALGRIAVVEGIEALELAIIQPDLTYTTIQALSHGLFTAAENALANDKPADAVRLYDGVYAVETAPDVIRAAALRGAVLARHPKEGLPLLMDALKDDNIAFFAAALRTALEMEEKEDASATIADVLPTLPPYRKILAIQAIGELGQDAAGPVLLKEAETGDVPVRVAALGAATRLAHAPVIPLLTELVVSEDADLAKAARESLSFFPGEAGDAAIKDMLGSEDAQVRRIAVELISQGALPEPVNLLMRMARDDADEPVRIAALKGAREYIGLPQMPALLDHLLKPRSSDEMLAAEQGLRLLCSREKELPAEIIADLRDALAAAEGETKLAVVRVLSATGDQKAFDAVLPLASSDEEPLRDAAVRAVCDWPTFLALPTVMKWVETDSNDTTRVLALRGAVRLLALGHDTPETLTRHYAALLENARSSDEKRLILSGLAKVSHAEALTMVLEQLDDESVKAEAIQAAITIAKNLGATPENAEALEQALTLIPELKQ